MAKYAAAGEPMKSGANRGQPDPITNRRMSDGCWNNQHFDSPGQNRCTGYMDSGARCECVCHDPKEYKPRVKRDKNATMSIMETGCGTIEIKKG